MEFTGKVIARTDKREGTSANGNHWSCVSYVIEEVNAQYPKKVCVEIFGDDRVNLAMSTKLGGKIVTAHFDIDCSEYQGKYYNRIRCWKMLLDGNDVLATEQKSSTHDSTHGGQIQYPPQGQAAPQVGTGTGQPAFDNNESNEELPF